MKTKIILLVTFCLLLVTATAQNNNHLQQLGYWVVIDLPGKKLEIVKTTDASYVERLSQEIFPGNCVNFAKELHHQPVFIIDNGSKIFYAELKRVTPNGKYRRISNRQFSEMVQELNLASPETKTASGQTIRN